MDLKSEIQALLEKFHQATITADETRRLYQLLKENSPAMDELVDEAWATDFMLDVTPDSQNLLRNIHSKLGMSRESASTPYTLRRIITTTLRYAAIFTFGLGTAWFFWHNKSKESKPILHKNYYNVKVGYGSKTTVELPDGSVVNLNSGSTLSYPLNFSDASRTVRLEGEGFFEVKKDAKHPFLVQTKDITIKVLGTKFNVKSYPEDKYSEATLVSGKVQILLNRSAQTDDGDAFKPLEMVPNQRTMIFSGEVPTEFKTEALSMGNARVQALPFNMYALIQKDIKTDFLTSWKNNILVFNSESFNEIIKKLERWYNVDITLKSAGLSNEVFSGKFDRESIQDVLYALSLIQTFKYKIVRNQIWIY